MRSAWSWNEYEYLTMFSWCSEACSRASFVTSAQTWSASGVPRTGSGTVLIAYLQPSRSLAMRNAWPDVPSPSFVRPSILSVDVCAGAMTAID